MKTFAKSGILLFCFLFATNAYAATSCTVSATGLNFGTYDVFSAFNTDSTGIITVSCTSPWPVVTISVGPSNSGGFNPRKMKNSSSTNTLNYNIFTDSAMSSIWGDGTSGTQTVIHSPNKKTVPETLYGRIPPGQDISAGLYIDTLTVTIIW